jgi:drug/metabolite transporter (DMT)-like permease
VSEAVADRRAEIVRARLFLVLLILGWGVTWPVMRIALEEIPPFSMRVGSLVVGVLALLIIARLQGRRLGMPDRKTWLHLVVASVFNIIAFNIFTPFAQLAAETGRVAIIVYTMPIWASLLAWPILRERLDAIRIAALVIGVAGMAVLIYPLTSLGIPTGILLALGAGVCWAVGTVYLKWAKVDADPMAITIWQLVFGLIFVGACLPVFEGSLHLGQAHAQAIVALLFSGFVGTGISYFLWFDIVGRLPAATASLAILSVPVLGIISSVIMLGEHPTLSDIAGFALIFIASACVLLWSHERDSAPAS